MSGTGEWTVPPASLTTEDYAGPGDEEQLSAQQPLNEERLWPTGLAEWFVIGQTALPALLFLPGSQVFRLPLRIGAFAMSLLAFVVWWFDRGGKHPARHPAERWLVFVLMVLVIMIAHPLTNNLTSGIAQTLLYFSIFCPLFWTPAYIQRPRQLVRILAITLVANGLNSMVGVLQVYDPSRWMPRELSAAFLATPNALGASTYIGLNGVAVIRPPGLFDTPGAVCGAGTIAALLGLVFALEPMAWWKRAAALGFAAAGISAIYLSHVRAALLISVLTMAVYIVSLALQNQKTRATGFLALAAGLVVAGLSVATFLAGDAVRERFTTLFEEDPRHLYYQSRGLQLEYAFENLVVEYPLGAGLARWGVMRNYFGDLANLDSTEVFAELQPNAWILDGGIFLLLLYSVALLVTIVYEAMLSRRLIDWDDRRWAATVMAVNFGTVALIFSFVPFGTGVGLQFWFLEGVLHGAMLGRPRRQ